MDPTKLPDHEPPTVEPLEDGLWQLVFNTWKNPAWEGWHLVVEARAVPDPKQWADDPDEWPTQAPTYYDLRTHEGGWLAWIQAVAILDGNPLAIEGREEHGGWRVSLLDFDSASVDQINEMIRGRVLISWPQLANRGGGQPRAFSNEGVFLARLDLALRAIAERRLNRITRIDVAGELMVDARTLTRSLKKAGKDWDAVENRYQQLLAEVR